MSVTVPDGWVKVGEATVPTTSFAPTVSKDLAGNDLALTAGVAYKLKASDTGRLASATYDAWADAEFRGLNDGRRLDARPTGTKVDYGLAVDDATPPTTVNGAGGAPGPQYQKPNRWTAAGGTPDADHEYLADYTGTGGTAKFFYLDDDYSDNTGSISVEIYAVLPTVSVTATDADGSEDGRDPVTFTFTRHGGSLSSGGTVSDDTSADLDVYFTLGAGATPGFGAYPDGIATDGADFTGLEAAGADGRYKVRIPAGSSTKTLTLTPLNDAEFEGTEQVPLALAPGTVTSGLIAYAAPAQNPATQPAAANAEVKGLNVKSISTRRPDRDANVPNNVAALIQDLGNDDAGVRANAENALTAIYANYPSIEVPLLQERATNPVAEVQGRINRILATIAPPKVVLAQIAGSNELTLTLPEAAGAGEEWVVKIEPVDLKVKLTAAGGVLTPNANGVSLTIGANQTAGPNIVVATRESVSTLLQITWTKRAAGGGAIILAGGTQRSLELEVPQ